VSVGISPSADALVHPETVARTKAAKIAKPNQKDRDFIFSPFLSAAIVATEMQTRLGYTFYIVP
jgi:hypothetical protein